MKMITTLLIAGIALTALHVNAQQGGPGGAAVMISTCTKTSPISRRCQPRPRSLIF